MADPFAFFGDGVVQAVVMEGARAFLTADNVAAVATFEAVIDVWIDDRAGDVVKYVPVFVHQLDRFDEWFGALLASEFGRGGIVEGRFGALLALVRNGGGIKGSHLVAYARNGVGVSLLKELHALVIFARRLF